MTQTRNNMPENLTVELAKFTSAAIASMAGVLKEACGFPVTVYADVLRKQSKEIGGGAGKMLDGLADSVCSSGNAISLTIIDGGKKD